MLSSKQVNRFTDSLTLFPPEKRSSDCTTGTNIWWGKFTNKLINCIEAYLLNQRRRHCVSKRTEQPRRWNNWIANTKYWNKQFKAKIKQRSMIKLHNGIAALCCYGIRFHHFLLSHYLQSKKKKQQLGKKTRYEPLQFSQL